MFVVTGYKRNSSMSWSVAYELLVTSNGFTDMRERLSAKSVGQDNILWVAARLAIILGNVVHQTVEI